MSRSLKSSSITKSSTAEYFAKNLQQVGFSSPAKAVLTTLKESVDNALDACEDSGILPELFISVKKIGSGSSRNTELIEVVVEDNGPGISVDNLPRVFGEYLASSKFGRGRCSRGQQGIGISAATTWAQLTNASGVEVVSKTKSMSQAVKGRVDVDIKKNKGIWKKAQPMKWNKRSGLCVRFAIDGKVFLNGDGGLLTYLHGTALVNPHLSLKYKLLENKPIEMKSVTDVLPEVPPSVLPHPHTMKLGEFLTHAHLHDTLALKAFLKKGFSRVSDGSVKDLMAQGLPKTLLNKRVSTLTEAELRKVFSAIQNTPLPNPSTRSVLTVGEESLAKSIQRLGDIDFFSVVTRKPKICDFKPVVVEVALARFQKRVGEGEEPIKLLRFANRVPLQFDKASCAITKAAESVNWRAYGLTQPKKSLPLGPYVFAVSVTSPFIKFKNASKETIDASIELVDEIRKALIQAGQKLSRHLRREHKAADLERKISHIEKFAPILVESLARITKAPLKRKKKAETGLKKILGRDTNKAEAELQLAKDRLADLKSRDKTLVQISSMEDEGVEASSEAEESTSLKKSKAKKQARKAKVQKSKKAVLKKKSSKKASKKAKTSVGKKSKKKSKKRGK